MPSKELVYIVHPDVDALGGPVPRYAFDEVWEPKGWKIAGDEDIERYEAREADVAAAAAGEIPLTSMSRGELVAMANERGLTYEDKATKADLIELLEGGGA
jgi:hypothetical protein